MNINLSIMYLKKNIATSESGFIFNPSTGDSYSANPVAAEIVQLLKQGTASSSVKEQILQKYEVDPFRLEQDWDDFMNQLKEANLIGD
jgi:hypothetical protein